MPITPSYSWSETNAWITVDVLLQSVSQSALDIVTTDCYIKVNCLPYLFQVDLHDDIDTHKSSAMVDKCTVKFYLVKKTEGMWQRLTAVGDRKMILERRQKSLDAIREAAQKVKTEAGAKVSQIRRLAVGSQMKLEESKRKTIEARKEAELKEERDALRSWKDGLEKKAEKEMKPEHKHGSTTENKSFALSQGDLLNEWRVISSESETGTSVTVDKEDQEKKPEKTVFEKLSRIQPRKLLSLNPGGRIIPAPRRSFRVAISFTQKQYPNHLPARESREKELQFKKHVPVSEDAIDVSEREPLFLQDKADKFYRSGDFKSAINAYTDAIQKDASMILCYANRAACYLRAKQLQSSIEDCTKAIRLLKNEPSEQTEQSTFSNVETSTDGSTPLQLDLMPLGTLDLLTTDPAAVNDAATSRKIESCILLRSGSAKCHRGDYRGGALDFELALKINPSNKDIKRVLDYIANRPPEGCVRVC